MKLLEFCCFQGHARFLLPLFMATAMSFPIRNSYDRRLYHYDHFPAARYIHQIMPFHIRQNRSNYITEGNIYNTNVLRIGQEEPKNNQCKYFHIFNKINKLIKLTMKKLTHLFIDIVKNLLDKTV